MLMEALPVSNPDHENDCVIQKVVILPEKKLQSRCFSNTYVPDICHGHHGRRTVYMQKHRKGAKLP